MALKMSSLQPMDWNAMVRRGIDQVARCEKR